MCVSNDTNIKFSINIYKNEGNADPALKLDFNIFLLIFQHK